MDTLIANVTRLLTDIPENSIISRTLHDDEVSKTVLFGFAAGQALSEHTASMPAILYFVQGTGRLTLGPDEHTIQAGVWTHMPARLPHSVHADSTTIMLLTLLKGGKES